MTKMYAIKRANLPMSLPIHGAVTLYLLLEHIGAPPWVQSILWTCWTVYFVVCVVLVVLETPVDLFAGARARDHLQRVMERREREQRGY